MNSQDASIDRFMQMFNSSELDGACHSFAEAGSSTPSVIWSPSKRQLLNPLIEQFYDICQRKCRENGQFYTSDLEISDFGPLAEWIMVVRIDRLDQSFVYAHYGSGIADHFGRDMTGMSTDYFSGHITQFFNAAYRETARRRKWVLTEHEPPKQVFVCAWRRLLLPLIGASEEVAGFLAINVPESPMRTGLDMLPDPVFVVDADENIRFANTSARIFFNVSAMQQNEMTLNDVAGFQLNLPDGPDVLFAKSAIENWVENLHLGKHLTNDFLVTVSGAVHAGRAYYIVMLRVVIETDQTTPAPKSPKETGAPVG